MEKTIKEKIEETTGETVEDMGLEEEVEVSEVEELKKEIKKELYFSMLTMLISSKYDILTDKEIAKQANDTLHHFITTRKISIKQ